jgi:hypothetical protein
MRRAGELFLVLTLCCTVTGAYAVHAGQDTNWDQRNYHFYSVFAWLSDRSDMDVAPGQLQTWINPLPHVPQYWLIRHLPPVEAGIAMGALAGFNGLLLWVLTRRLLGDGDLTASRACAALVTAMGLTGSIYVSDVGTTFAEYLCSPFILAALIVLVPVDRATGAWSTHSLLLSGLFLGCATGLKLTNGAFAAAMLVSLIALSPAMTLRPRGVFAFAAGGLAGFAACGGLWALRLERAFGNPTFPFFNAVFHSPWFDVVNVSDTRFAPPGFFHAAVTYPFVWLLGVAHPTSEVPFREPRFALVAVSVLPGIAASLWRLRQSEESVSDPDLSQKAERTASTRIAVDLHDDALRIPGQVLQLAPTGATATWSGESRLRSRSIDLWLLTLFFVISYGLWLEQFGVQRYVLPLELLSGALILLNLERVVTNLRAVAVTFGVVVVVAALWTRPADWSRIPYSSGWFDIVPPASSPSGNLYVMLSDEPMSYAIPFMYRHDRFVRVEGNIPLEPETPLGRRAAEIIQQFPGPIRTLSVAPVDDDARALLRRFGLTVQTECQTFQSRLDTFVTCGLQRASQGQDLAVPSATVQQNAAAVGSAGR